MRIALAATRPIELSARPGLLLRLVDTDGRIGWGEASPLPGYSPDDLGAAASALDGLARMLLEFETDADPRAAVRHALAPMQTRLARSPSARCALETALLDLIGQRAERSIAWCLGGSRSYPDVGRNALLHARAGVAEIVEGARGIVERGVRALKVKLSARDEVGLQREIGVLRAVRRALPPDFELRLDANGGWSLDEARSRLAELASLDVRYVEQPVAPERLVELGVCRTPWAADESLRLAGLPERLAAAGCAVFVLKPQVLGLVHAHDLGTRAQELGLDVVVTHLFEGPVGMAAACELALSLPRPPLACGLDPHDPCAANIPHLAVPGRVTGSNRPGLGVSGSVG